MGSDNPNGADNQQERLIELGWVLGFVDGEGCFSIGFVRQGGGRGRSAYKLGYQVAHRFVVSQGVSSMQCLEDLPDFFGGAGCVYANLRHDNHREQMAQYVVQSRSELLEEIVPFFERHPLRSAKRTDFEKFARCMYMIDDELHRTRECLLEIVEIAQTMNRRKARPDLVRILRGHTPEVQDTGS
jgi:hypothetical protein